MLTQALALAWRGSRLPVLQTLASCLLAREHRADDPGPPGQGSRLTVPLQPRLANWEEASCWRPQPGSLPAEEADLQTQSQPRLAFACRGSIVLSALTRGRGSGLHYNPPPLRLLREHRADDPGSLAAEEADLPCHYNPALSFRTPRQHRADNPCPSVRLSRKQTYVMLTTLVSSSSRRGDRDRRCRCHDISVGPTEKVDYVLSSRARAYGVARVLS
jgi:hypothetical protein